MARLGALPGAPENRRDPLPPRYDQIKNPAPPGCRLCRPCGAGFVLAGRGFAAGGRAPLYSMRMPVPSNRRTTSGKLNLAPFSVLSAGAMT